MRKVLSICLLFFFFACNSNDKRAIAGKTEYQRKLNAQYKDASRSPLKKKDLKGFKGLDFYPVDSTYIVTAQLTRTPDSPYFEMATTTDRKPLYREYGLLTFSLLGKEHTLTLYRSLEEERDPRYKDYLFLPFTDETSGDGSYGGGRYMDVFESTIQGGDLVTLNFNNTYNPYCAYSDGWNCPIVPIENHLDMKVEAGVKGWLDH